MTDTGSQELARTFLNLWLKQARDVVQDPALMAQGMEILRGVTANCSATAPPTSGFMPPPQLMPLHFSLQSMCWQQMMGALAGSSMRPGDGTPFGMDDSTTLFALMRRMAEDPALAASVRSEIQHRLHAQTQAMQAYYQARYERTLTEPSCVWQQGNCRVLRYPGKAKKRAPAMLLVPSLINRYHILDLTETSSFARYLAMQGYPVYLVDWGEPTDAEKSFDAEAYVTRYLCAVGEFLRAQGHARTVATGHCMGGMLCVALAAIRPDLVNALGLLATPWDFAADPLHPLLQGETGLSLMGRYIGSFDFFPGEHVLAMFYLRDPWLFQEKLEHFYELAPGSESYERFLAVEHWVNGCVPLTRGVALDGFLHWGAHNQPYAGQWRVGGRLVDPAQIMQPAYVVTPRKDRIVRYASALPLARLLPGATHCAPDTGHVGMIVGSQAKAQMWEPFTHWITTLP